MKLYYETSTRSVITNLIKRDIKAQYTAPHCFYHCHGGDRWGAIPVFTDEEWENFCKVIANPSLAEAPRFTALLNRNQNEDELDKIMEEWVGLTAEGAI